MVRADHAAPRFSNQRELGDPIPVPSTQIDSYPPSLDAICEQALAPDPAQRFRSAAEMRDALLATARTLESTGDPSQSLASKLMRLFGDRISQKRDLLDRARVGMPLGDLVPTEADEEIEVPRIQREQRATIMDADLRAPELAQIARVSRQKAVMFDDDLVTNKPWSNRVPQPLAAQDAGVIVSLPPTAVATVPRALLLFILAAGLGGAAGAYLRLYY